MAFNVRITQEDGCLLHRFLSDLRLCCIAGILCGREGGRCCSVVGVQKEVAVCAWLSLSERADNEVWRGGGTCRIHAGYMPAGRSKIVIMVRHVHSPRV